MANLNYYRYKDIENLINKRKGEEKLGESLLFVEKLEDISSKEAKYVLLGIPEDVGVRANYGNPGTANAWKTCLKSLVNVQKNRFNNPMNVILLGEIDCRILMEKASNIDNSDPNYHAKFGDLVKEIDQLVAQVIEKIISYGKIPIIIGGGHNNAYGNIKGAAKALKQPVNVINIDAHTDLRQLEHRHSGNGFSYAIEGQYLCNYSVFGLHKNYTPEYIFEEMDQSDNLSYHILEDLLEKPEDLSNKFKAIVQSNDRAFGLELDCDAIADFPSSAASPSGFSVDQVRTFIQLAAKKSNCCYFHICEAAPNENSDKLVGKALSYFITDIISPAQ